MIVNNLASFKAILILTSLSVVIMIFHYINKAVDNYKERKKKASI